jgi:hypothetical protein
VTPEYEAFLAGKALRAEKHGMIPAKMPDHLFDFQKASVDFLLRIGRGALFHDTGLGKTRQEGEFGKQASEATGLPSLLLAPLSVVRQSERELRSLGYQCLVIRSMADVRPGINICHYDLLHKIDPSAFGCAILDESGIIKSFQGKTTQLLIQMFKDTPFRLCATATPAPNDYIEIGSHCEFLGIMSQAEMLARFFIHDSANTQEWRLKGHAIEAFWDWVASWAVMASSPEDLGFDGSRYILPQFEVFSHPTIGEIKPMNGGFFGSKISATNMHKKKRETTEQRAAKAREIIGSDKDQWVIWCDTDYEQDRLEEIFRDRAISIRGSQSPEKKEELHLAWLDKKRPLMITKISMFGWGVNWQQCHKMLFVGRSFSYERWYQGLRRMWRFGQKEIVLVHIIVADGEDQIGRVLDRKADAHAEMKAAMLAASRRALKSKAERRVRYNPSFRLEMPRWLKSTHIE